LSYGVLKITLAQNTILADEPLGAVSNHALHVVPSESRDFSLFRKAER